MLILLALAAQVKAFPLNAVQDPGFEDPKHAPWDNASAFFREGESTPAPWGDASPYVGAHAGKRAWDFATGLAGDFGSVSARLAQTLAPTPVRQITEASVWAKATPLDPKGVRIPPRLLTIIATYTEGKPTSFMVKPTKSYTKVDFLSSLAKDRVLTGIAFLAEGSRDWGGSLVIDDVAIVRTVRLSGKP